MIENATKTNLVRSDIAETVGYVPGEQPTDTGTVKLNTNENPYPPSARVLEAIQAVSAEQMRRYPNPNARLFREAAAKLHGVPADWILTFNGGDDLLNVAIRTCAGQEDKVAFLDPSYSLYPVLTNIQGARACVIPYKVEGTNWALPKGIEKTDASLLLIVNPNAPSGHLDPLDQIDHFVQNFRGVVLIDEAYVDFANQSALHLVHKYENLVILRSMSKGYSLAGLRFGYAISQPTLLAQFEKVRDSYPCDVISIAAATAAIEDQEYAQSTWNKVRSERARLSSALASMGFKLPESQSNFLLAQVPSLATNKRSAMDIYQTLKSRGILVRWWDLPLLQDKLRITVGTPEQNDRLLAELKAVYGGQLCSGGSELD